MKRRNPPALAVWLNRLGVSEGNEPLAGDLLEEFRSGRTAGWYWRQTLMAICAEPGRRICPYRHILLGVVVGSSVETGALLAARLFDIPWGLALVGAVLPVCIQLGIGLLALRNNDPEAEKSSERFDRSAGPGLATLISLCTFAFFDALIAFADNLTQIRTALLWLLLIHLYLLFLMALFYLRNAKEDQPEI